MNEASLVGRSALVTGAGVNIGRAVALALAARGANVAVNCLRNRARAEAVAEEIRAYGVDAVVLPGDVSAPEVATELIDQAAARLGSLDILVSNVGSRPFQPLLSITAEDWQRVINTNLNAAFYLARAALPHMCRASWGRIILISGSDVLLPIPNRAHVTVSKSGLSALARAIALEFGAHGVTANTVAPGWIDTERDLANYPDYDAQKRHLLETLPLRRLGRVEDIANACVYLASPMGAYVTGQAIHVNGGEAMG
ncbi:MAG: SDR family oxidoreductase [Nannocystaceae bacterium]